MKDIKIGSKVCLINDWKMTGEVVEQGKDKWSFMIKWDLNAAPSEESEDELRPFDPEKDKANIQKLQEQIDTLEAAFRSFAGEKLNDIAHGLLDTSLYDLEDQGLINTDRLCKAMDDAGWSSSSLYC